MWGEFISCSNYPICSFTCNVDGTPTKRKREVTDWDENGIPEEYAFVVQPQKKVKHPCPYKRCDGSGLLPFVGKDGKARSDVHLFCDCHPQYGENAKDGYYSPLRPEDIDYPVSYSYWRSLCQNHGWQDPGSDYPPEPHEEAPKEQVIVHRHSNMGKLEYDLLQQTANQVKFLQAKVDELTRRRKPLIKSGAKPITTGKPEFKGTV